jgi:hypothetical protein
MEESETFKSRLINVKRSQESISSYRVALIESFILVSVVVVSGSSEWV